MPIGRIGLILKNAIFNGNSFAKSKTLIGFMASKKVREWSQILILSLGWSDTQNETNLNGHFLTVSLEKLDFSQTAPNISKLYTKLKLSKRRVDMY